MSGPASGSRPDFWAWWDAREPAWEHLAFLLTLDSGRGRALLARALPPIAADWARIGVDHADGRVLADVCAALRRQWDAGPPPTSEQLPPTGNALADTVWEMLCTLSGAERAAVVLSLREGLDPDEVAGLVGGSPEAIEVLVDTFMAEVAALAQEAVRRRPVRLLSSPEALLDDVCVERADAAAYQPVDRAEVAHQAARLRRRRHLVTVGATTALVVVAAGLTALLGPADPQPEAKMAYRGRPAYIPQLPLAR
jgi:hypothetical protein